MENPITIKMLAHFEHQVYLELYQTSEIEGLTKMVEGYSYNYSSTTFDLGCLKKF